MTEPAPGLSRGVAMCSRIADVHWRDTVRVQGRVRALRVQPWEGDVATLECTLVDETGGITLVFLGRRQIGGIKLGAHLEAAGTVLETRGKLAIMNPEYTLLPHISTPVAKKPAKEEI